LVKLLTTLLKLNTFNNTKLFTCQEYKIYKQINKTRRTNGSEESGRGAGGRKPDVCGPGPGQGEIITAEQLRKTNNSMKQCKNTQVNAKVMNNFCKLYICLGFSGLMVQSEFVP
jgi:hypothetical protein